MGHERILVLSVCLIAVPLGACTFSGGRGETVQFRDAASGVRMESCPRASQSDRIGGLAFAELRAPSCPPRKLLLCFDFDVFRRDFDFPAPRSGGADSYGGR
jgi:hypothetical protein